MGVAVIKHPNFVANDTAGSRKETAVLLVGTAREFGIHQRSIRSTSSGYWITDELAAIIYDESEPEPEPEPEPTKTSGNRAAKKTSTSRKEQE